MVHLQGQPHTFSWKKALIRSEKSHRLDIQIYKLQGDLKSAERVEKAMKLVQEHIKNPTKPRRHLIG